MSKELIERYDKVIYDLFIFMSIVLVYMLLCQQWLISIIYGLAVYYLYVTTTKEIKNIKESISIEKLNE